MAKEPENIEGVEGPKEGTELLSILLRFGKIPESSAARDLGVDIDTIRGWEKTLAADGWIKPPERRDPDPLLELSPDYDKKISHLGGGIIREKARAKPSSEKKTKEKKTSKPHINTVLLYDILVLANIATALHLFRKYAKNPDRGSMSLLVGALLFFVAILVLKSYRRVSKDKKASINLKTPLKVLNETLTRQKVYIRFIIVILFAIAFVGNYLTSRNPVYLLLLAFPVSSIPIVFLRRTTRGFLVRYYAGILALAYALLLFAGFYSVSEQVLGESQRIVDVIAGFVVLGLIRSFEKKFGVGVSFIIDLVNREKKKEESE